MFSLNGNGCEGCEQRKSIITAGEWHTDILILAGIIILVTTITLSKKGKV